MKKSLVALAVLAASGASFAQVTITGGLGFSYQQDPAIGAGGSHVQGMSLNDGEIYVTAMEDLGGGMSAVAKGGFTMRGRGTAIADRDGFVMLNTPSGNLMAGAIRSCGSLDAVKSGAVTGTVYSSNESNKFVPLDTCAVVDAVAYTLPKMGNLTVQGLYGEFQSAITAFNSNSKGNTNGLSFYDLQAIYAAGPLMVQGNATFFLSKTAATAALDGMTRGRLVGTYDMGVAKLGAGYQFKSYGYADQYIASIAIPAGNAVIGLDFMGRAAQTAFTRSGATETAALVAAAASLGSQANGDKASTAVGLGVTYNFSKLTNLNVSYITYTDAGANTLTPTASQLDTEYRIRLTKNF